MAPIKVSVVTQHRSTIGEGPYWDATTKKLIYVDIKGKSVHRLNPEDGSSEHKTINSDVGFAIPRKSDRNQLIIGAEHKIQYLNWDNGSLTDLATVEEELQGNRFNDAKCDVRGRLWAGTMGPESAPGVVTPNRGNLYCFEANRIIKRGIPVTISNGMDWTSDNKIMYYIDSTPRHVYAFDFDEATGEISNQRTVIDFSKLPGDNGLPDGMALDLEGKIWVACFNGSQVLRLDPETGKLIQALTLSANQVTSVCFGGPDYQDLYVTSACNQLSSDDLQRYPDAGRVFRITGLGVRGAAAYDFAG